MEAKRASKIKAWEFPRLHYYVKRGFFLYMERPYVINPFVGSILKILTKYNMVTQTDKKHNQDGHNNQGEDSEAESTSKISEDQLLAEIYEECGMAEKQNDSRVKTLNRLLDYISEKSRAATSKEELLSLYKMYIKEWIYLICYYQPVTTLGISGTED